MDMSAAEEKIGTAPVEEVVSRDAKGAVEYFIDPAEEKKVVWKIDRVIMSLMFVGFFFQFLDKQTINYASVFGLSKSLHLSGSDFSWAISIYYFGLMTAQLPSAYFIGRFHVPTVVAIAIVLWGICEMSQAACSNPTGLLITRFFLGACEGVAQPGFVIITSDFYKRSEHPMRVAVWQSCNGAAQIVGGLLMYAIGLSHHLAISSWRVIFLVAGAGTVVTGLFFAWLMPQDTTTAWFLNEDERRIATERLAADRSTRDRADFNRAQVKEALTEWHTLLFFFIPFFICVPAPIVKFSSLVVHGFGFSPLQTMLVGLPAGVLQIATTVGAALAIHWTRNSRCFWAIAFTLIPVIGTTLLLSLPARYQWGIVVSTWFAQSFSSVMLVGLSILASNIKGNTKKAVVGAVYFVGYSVGCIVGPQLWQSQDAPRYIKGCITSLASFVILDLILLMYYFVFRSINRKRDAEDSFVHRPTVDGITRWGVSTDSDMTDTADRGFRYSL